MKKRYVKIVLLFLILMSLPGAVYAGQSEELTVWEKANELYYQKDYEGALKAYQEVLKENPKDPAVYYNLGNVYYKTGKTGYAVLNYEKALRLAPRSRETRENLKFAEAQIPVTIEDARPAVFRWLIDKTRYFRMGEAIGLSLIFYCGLLIAVIFQLLRRGRNWLLRFRRLTAILLLLSLVLVGIKFYDLRAEDGILITPQAEARYGPSLHEGSAFRLPDGILVKVVDQIGDWYRIELSNQETGWVEKNSVGII